MPHWKFQLCNTDSTMSAIGELTGARDRSLDLILNRPGSLRFTINAKDHLAGSIEEGVTCVKAYRDNVCRWSGPIWGIDEGLPDKNISVSCVGWQEELNQRPIEDWQEADPRTRPEQIDAGLIAYNLLALANEQTNESGIIVPTHITAGIRDLSQLRTRRYQRWANIGASIQELSDIEAGFDYHVDPVTRMMNIDYDQIKAGLYGRGTDRINTLFAIGWPAGPRNLQRFQRTIDVSQMKNRIVAQGRYGSYKYGDLASQNKHGIFTEQIALSDVTNEQILKAFAVAEIAVRSKPKVVYSMDPFPYTDRFYVPQIFIDYNIGDIVYVTALGGRISIERQPIRVFGATINIDNEGVERVTGLQTSPTA